MSLDVVQAQAAALKPLITYLTSTTHDGKAVVGTAPDGVLHYTVRQSGFEETAFATDAAKAKAWRRPAAEPVRVTSPPLPR